MNDLPPPIRPTEADERGRFGPYGGRYVSDYRRHRHMSPHTTYTTLDAAVDAVSRVVAGLPGHLPPRGACPCGCDRALSFAVMTAPEKREPAMVARLQGIAGRVL